MTEEKSKTPAEERRKRLAAELRANLKRRKDKSREGKERDGAAAGRRDERDSR